MPSARLIALIGADQRGKDTACRLLGGYRLAFADELKRDLAPVILDRYGISLSAMTPREKEIIRPLLVAHGMVARVVRADMWIEPLLDRLDAVQGAMNAGHVPVNPICITDCRFRNEAIALLKRGARLVYITRLGCEAANEEERQSLAEIRELAEGGEIPLTMVANTGSLVECRDRLLLAVGDERDNR